MDTLETLNRKRGAIKAKITSLNKVFELTKNAINNNEVNKALFSNFQHRLSLAKGALPQFDTIQDQIESLDPDIEKQINERDNFYETYHKTIDESSDLLIIIQSSDENANKDNTSVSNFQQTDINNSPQESNGVNQTSNILNNSTSIQNVSNASNVVQSPNASNASTQIQNLSINDAQTQFVKLPTIHLPKFNGDIEKWLEFRDTFSSLIHSNAGITNIQRFHYLRASLEAEAAIVINELEFTDNNYKIAWDTLNERYNNKNRLIFNHVKSLFNLENIIKESSIKLRKLLDAISKHLRALQSLNQPVEFWDTLIIYLAVTKLDNQTSREWEIHKADNHLPSLNEFTDFLKTRANILEQIELNRSDKNVILDKKTQDKKSHSRSLVVNNSNCIFCNQNHSKFTCNEFLKLNINDRYQKVKELKLCTNCLNSGHFSKQCKAGLCRKCNSKHNTLLHNDSTKNQSEQPQQTNSNAEISESNTNNVFAGTQNIINSHVLLSTILCKVKLQNNKTALVRALLDCGSQSSFITNDCCKRLNLSTKKVNLTVSGLNCSLSNINEMCEIELFSNSCNYSLKLNCHLVPRITEFMPSHKINISIIKIPNDITLADPRYYEPQKVDILIGADHFWHIISSEQHYLGKNLPILHNTKFGWVISGTIPIQNSNRVQCNFTSIQAANSESNSNKQLCNQLNKFWEIEDCSHKKFMSKEELDCESHFQQHYQRNEEGRFIVSIPLCKDISLLGNSKALAEKQFFSLERKLKINKDFKQLYHAFIQEYIDLKHMSKVDNNSESVTSYYMPHHGVYRANSLTTKLRVVFNGSAPTSTNISFNDIQMAGPVIQDQLWSILIRFRTFKYIISADITKMYRQILVNPNQRSLQRILWRFDENSPLDTYELNTVTYGTKSASFLSIRCLFELANIFENDYPTISNIIRKDFYVDDLLTGVNSIAEGQKICILLSKILQSGCFELRKWMSNCPDIVKVMTNKNIENCILPLELDNDNTKVLGLNWSCIDDVLLYNINIESKGRITKRSILSCIASIFDPLGLISPIVIIFKLLIQQLWLEKIDWDSFLPMNIQNKWISICKEINELKSFRIPRFILCDKFVRVEIHGFCDASQKAYGCCVYLRSYNSSNQITVNLLCAKAKVAPIKILTIPRLELCGAVILARLVKKVQESLTLTISSVTLWTDSTIILGWLKMSPGSLKPFVAHRISEIQDLTNISNWRHVNSESNPADILSRGISPQAIINCNLWWQGPQWLSQHSDNWPISVLPEENLPEVQKEKICLIQKIQTENIIDKFSNMNTLIRTVAYCLRFLYNCSHKNKRLSEILSLEETNHALMKLVKISQSDSFSKSIDEVKKQYANLTPFLDNNNIIRVGGRLINSDYNYDKKHPILLSGKNHLSYLIVKQEHLKMLHAGPQLLLSSLRERFWILSGRNLCRSVIKQCVRCSRFNPKPYTPLMGNLPKERIQSPYPFYYTGTDYAGPITIRDKKGRGCKNIKAYICIFVCLTTKALHIELVTDLSSEGFIMILRRFVSRRGKPSKIFSDNGRNYVGANHMLKDFVQSLKSHYKDIDNFLVSEGIQWSFIPPYAPHFGGLWEAGVKSVKFHLNRVVCNTILTFEEMYTVLVQIEGILNSRPLCELSSDPNDFSCLTPSHFLVGRPITSVPEPVYLEVPDNRLNRFQLIQKLAQHFWKRWSQEYLHGLQQRNKWKFNSNSVKINDMVLIKEDNIPVKMWRLGRISELHPGPDGITRVVTIKTLKGYEKRPVSRICPLTESECVKD